MSTRIRILDVNDAFDLAELYRANRDFLTPYEPTRPGSFFTERGQLELAERKLTDWQAGLCAPFVILGEREEVVGAININDIVRGAFESASLGYWVAQDAGGRGFAKEAVASAAAFSFEVLGLHRLQAATLLDNERSQAVLRAAGFEEFGVAPSYLRIDGQWRDHRLFQLLAAEEAA